MPYNTNGYSSGHITIRSGNTELVNMSGPILNGDTLQVKIPVQGIEFEGQLVKSISAACWIE